MALGKSIKGITIEFDGNASNLVKTLTQVDSALTKTQRALKIVDDALKFDSDNPALLAQRIKLVEKATVEANQKLKGLKEILEAAEKGTQSLNDEQLTDLIVEIAKTETQLKELNETAKNFELKNSMAKVDAEIDKVTGSLNNVKKALKLDPTSVDLITQKFKLTSEAVKLNSQKLQMLQKTLRDAKLGVIQLDETELADLTSEIAKTQAEIEDLVTGSNNAGNSFEESAKKGEISYSELAGKVRLLRYAFNAVKDVVEEVTDAMKKAEEIAFDVTQSVTSTVTSVVQSSLTEYANFEQRWFAMQTLFEEETGRAVQTVANDASNAWSTMGLSATEYFEASQNFLGAILRTTSDETVAADITRQALQAMADDATFFGNSLEENITVLRAVARNNFAMIDNLQLGVAGSQAGMVDLINMSGILDHEIESIHDDAVNFTVMLQAIIAYEEQLGVAGATATQGQTTLNGTMNQLKATWSNFMLSLSSDDLFSVTDAVDNLVAAGTNFISVWGEAANTVFENLAEALPELVSAFGEVIGGEGFRTLFNSIVTSISSLVPVIVAQVSPLFDAILSLITDNKDIISETFVSVFLIGNEIIAALIDSITEHADEITPIVSTILEALVTGMSNYFNVIGEFAITFINVFGEYIISNAVSLWTAAFNIILTLALSLIEALPTLLPYISDIVLAIVDALIQIAPALVPAATELILSLARGLVDRVPDIIGATVEIIMAMVNWLSTDGCEEMIEIAIELIGAFVIGIGRAIPQLSTGLADIWSELDGGFGQVIGRALNWGSDMISNFISGIQSQTPAVTSAVSGVASVVASYLHHTCPELGPLSNNLIEYSGKDMIEGFTKGMEDATPDLEAGLNATAQVVADGMTQYQPSYGSYLEEINRSIGASGQRQTPVNVYIGNEKIDSYIAGANYRQAIVGGNH